MSETQSDSDVRSAHSWLDKDFFQRGLRDAENDPDLVVKSYQVYPGTAAGDNYSTTVYRATVVARTKQGDQEYKFVIKCIPENEFRKAIVKNMNVFPKETQMYDTVFPTFLEFQMSKGVTKSLLSYVPSCTFSTMEEDKEALVLRDLAALGFKMSKGKMGLDLDHCKLVFSALGKFHALSFAMKKENFEEFQENFKLFKETMYIKANKPMVEPLLSAQMDTIVTTAKTFAGYEKYLPKLEELKTTVFDRFIEYCQPQEPTALLIHGDCWLNNMLFSYDAQDSPKELKLLDFQMSRYASFALDLVYFLFTSTTKQLRDEHQKDLLKIYHQSFTESVKALGSTCDEITLQVVEKELESKLLFGVITGFCMLPMILAAENAVPDIDSITEENMEEIFKTSRLNANPKLHSALKDMLDEIGGKFLL